MYKVLIYFALLFSITVMQGQDEIQLAKNTELFSYETEMSKGLDLWKNNKPWEATAIFERIIENNPDKWLPYYYIAQIHISSSFTESDAEALEMKLEKAQVYLDKGMQVSKDNAELFALQGHLYSAKIVSDPQKYGRALSEKAMRTYTKAVKLDPENPRVKLAAIEWNIGSAKYLGGSVASNCEALEKTIELFTNFKAKEPFYPTRGKERALFLQEEYCK